MNAEMKKIITHLVTRTMREGGFVGEVRVKNIRARQDNSYSATVDTSIGGGIGRATYRAIIRDGEVRVKRSSPVTITRPGRPVRQMG